MITYGCYASGAQKKFVAAFALIVAGFSLLPVASHAATVLPGGADIDRRAPATMRSTEDLHGSAIDAGSVDALPTMAPEGAADIRFVLKKVSIEGVTAFPRDALEPLYHDKIGQEISLDEVWGVAAAVTKRYRDAGYFLSRAYVPRQEVDKGVVRIRVVEGYVSDVAFDSAAVSKSAPVRKIVATIKAARPIKLSTLERQHLSLTDIAGLSRYQGTLSPVAGAKDGAVKLTFSKRHEKQRHAFVGFDNYGSRYLGPHEVSLGWQGEIVAQQQTTVTAATSVPMDELAALNFVHEVPLTPDLSIQATAGYTRTRPGYVLESQDIKGRAINAGVGLQYKVIRQRNENLKIGAAIDMRNSSSTILGADLSKDKLRVVRASADYDRVDGWRGYSTARAVLSHGIDGLGSSDASDANLSRAGAKPNFTKLELDLSRLQSINADWSGFMRVAGQKSSGSLFSSEEFGYGGQAFGRAYDQSEISGDDGLAGSAELRYHALPAWYGAEFMPYGFYDIGRVWNKNTGQDSVADASSAGAGVRMSHDNGLAGSLQLAFPLTRDVDAPLYGASHAGPRLGVQLGYAF